MSTKRPSASIRALKARAKVLTRPGFWGAAIVLLLPLIFLADYWNHPEKFPFLNADRPASPGSNNLSTDAANELPTISDASTVLDLPTLPDDTTDGTPDAKRSLVRTDFLNTLLSNSLSTEKKTADSNSERSRRTVPSLQRREPAKIDLSDAFSASPLSTTASPSANPGASQPGSAATNVQPNSLESALDRNFGESATDTANPITSSQTTESTQAAPNLGQFNPSPTSPSANPYSQPSGFRPYQPQTSPAPGTTGYTLPPAFRTPANTPTGNFYLNNSSPGSGGSSQITPPTQLPSSSYSSPPSYSTTPSYGNPSTYPTPTYANPQPQVQPSPFSIPRNPPGQHIGGGEINTFSNP